MVVTLPVANLRPESTELPVVVCVLPCFLIGGTRTREHALKAVEWSYSTAASQKDKKASTDKTAPGRHGFSEASV